MTSLATSVAPGELMRYRSLIWNFAQRDLKSRFKGTAMGWAWSLIVPLASLGIYSLVARVIFRAGAPNFGNGHVGNFTVFLFVALTVWSFWANGINTAIGSLLGTGVLLKKIYFPSYAPVFGAMIAVAIQSTIEVAVVLVVMLLFGNVGASWVLVPVLCLVFFVFVTAAALVFALSNIYFRDLQHIISVVLQLLFYATPIIYSISRADGHSFAGVSLRTMIMVNPVSEFVELFRDVIYKLQFGSVGLWAAALGWTIGALLLSVLAYRRGGRDLAEQL